MRSLLVIVWLFIGLSGLIYHLGPGVEQRARDRANRLSKSAFRAAAEGDHAEAVERLDEALLALPEDCQAIARRLRLEKAKSQMLAAQLPDAREALESLLQEVRAEEPTNTRLLHETQAALASSQYYLTWLMRLEGLSKDEWEPEIEAARQNYRVLAKSAAESGEEGLAERRREDLEAAIRLARLDLSELQALPLPSQ